MNNPTTQSRRKFLGTSLALATLPALGLKAKSADTSNVMKSKRPNIVYVFADQMRAFSIGGIPGADPVVTPRLDRFASESMNLRQATSTCPICSPHRAMLLSGRYPNKNSVVHNINSAPDRNFQLMDSQICVADVLAENGYDVGYIGKWHLTRPHEPYLKEFWNPKGRTWNEFTPPSSRHGIDFWYGYNTYDRHLRPMYWDNTAGRDDYKFVDQWGPEHETDVAIDYLKEHKDGDSPFALFISYNPPHPPFDQVPQNYLDIYKDATAEELLTRGNVRGPEGQISKKALESVHGHFAMVSGVDTQFGRLLDAIDKMGLSDDTLIVFTSDHGEMMGSQERMGKSIWYDESFRVPFLVRWPGKIEADSNSDLLIDTPDIPATLIGMAGLQERIPSEWQGRNFASHLQGMSIAKQPEAQMYWNDSSNLRGLRTQRYTLVMPGVPTDKEYTSPILFDNHDDPWQLTNIAQDKPKVVNELNGLLRDNCLRVDDNWEPKIQA